MHVPLFSVTPTFKAGMVDTTKRWNTDNLLREHLDNSKNLQINVFFKKIFHRTNKLNYLMFFIDVTVSAVVA